MVAAFGGKCGICGYNRHYNALQFHHLDPSKKKFAIGDVLATPKSWAKIVVELRKCVCICANCHVEVHGDAIKIPKNIPRFNEDYITYKLKIFKKEEFDPCPVCDKKKWKYQRTCSYKCAGKTSWRVDWEHVDLKVMLQKYSMLEIGRRLDVSDNAVRKRAKRLGLIKA